MPVTCSICADKRKLEIDRALASGQGHAAVAREYGMSRNAVSRHAARHLSRQLAQAWAKKEALQSTDILNEVEALIGRSKAILAKAEATNRLGIALKGIAEARNGYELLSKIAFSLHQVRLAELELERERSGAAADADLGEALAVLTGAELAMLRKLQTKIVNRDSSTIVIPDEPPPTWLSAGFEPAADPEQVATVPTFRRSKQGKQPVAQPAQPRANRLHIPPRPTPDEGTQRERSPFADEAINVTIHPVEGT